MYGTVARMRARPGTEDELRRVMDLEARDVPGFRASYVYRLDEDPQSYMLAVLFDDRETYHRNADDPAQDQEYRQLRALLADDPEWHDGEVVWATEAGDDAAANRRAMELLREAAEGGDVARLGALVKELAADDLVVEWPQSGERIRGVADLLAIDENYAGATGTNPRMTLRGMTGSGGTYVAEGTIDYGDGTPVSWVGIFELRGGRLIHETEYFANPFPAPEWRSRWVERM